jgi:hypothetical protein
MDRKLSEPHAVGSVAPGWAGSDGCTAETGAALLIRRSLGYQRDPRSGPGDRGALGALIEENPKQDRRIIWHASGTAGCHSMIAAAGSGGAYRLRPGCRSWVEPRGLEALTPTVPGVGEL